MSTRNRGPTRNRCHLSGSGARPHQRARLQPRIPKSLREDPAAPLPHPLPGLAATRGSHTRERRWAELRQWSGKPTLCAPQQRSRRDRTRGRGWHGAVQQAGSTSFLHPQKGLNPEAAFDRSREDGHPVPRPLRIGGALQRRRGAANPAVSHYCCAPGSAFVQRTDVLGSSPEVVLPAAHTSPEQVGGDVEVVPPPLRRNSSAVRKLQELDAEEGLGHLSPFSLILCGLSSASPVKM